MPDSHHHHSHVSSPQEPFLCDLSVGAHSHHSSSPSPSPSPSPASADSPPHSNAIVMVSPPDSEDSVSHTPPGNTSTLAFCDQPRVAREGDVDAGTPGFVDFCKGSEYVDLEMGSVLGLSEVQLTQEMGVNECSHGARRDVLGEIRDGRFDKVAVFDRELSETDESPGKKPKLSEGDLGIDSSGGCVEVQLQKVKEGVGNCERNLVSEENLETLVGNFGLCESDKVVCIIEGSKSSDGAVEDSGMEKKSDEERVLRVLPPSMRGPLKMSGVEFGNSPLKNAGSESECLKNAGESECLKNNAASESECLKNAAASGSECSKNAAASGVEFGNSREKKNVFDVLRALSEISNEGEENLDDFSLIEVAEACGITFPRPRWWPPEWENFDP